MGKDVIFVIVRRIERNVSLRLALGSSLFMICFSYFYLHSPIFNCHILLLHPDKKLSKKKKKISPLVFNLKRNRNRTERKNISVDSDWLHCHFFQLFCIFQIFYKR